MKPRHGTALLLAVVVVWLTACSDESPFGSPADNDDALTPALSAKVEELGIRGGDSRYLGSDSSIEFFIVRGEALQCFGLDEGGIAHVACGDAGGDSISMYVEGRGSVEYWESKRPGKEEGSWIGAHVWLGPDWVSE